MLVTTGLSVMGGCTIPQEPYLPFELNPYLVNFENLDNGSVLTALVPAFLHSDDGGVTGSRTTF